MPDAPTNAAQPPELALPLRRMRRDDLEFVVDQHRAFFPDNVMSRFGKLFLRRYYRSFLDTPYAFAAIAELDSSRAGYLVGIHDTLRHRQQLLRRHGVALFAVILVSFVTHPVPAVRVIARRLGTRIRRLARTARAPSVPPRAGRVAVLSHVATIEAARGRRLGQALVTRFVESARASGAARISLATGDGLDGAGPFYVRLGWQLTSRRQTFDGRWIRLYDLELHNDA